MNVRPVKYKVTNNTKLINSYYLLKQHCTKYNDVCRFHNMKCTYYEYEVGCVINTPYMWKYPNECKTCK